MDPRQTAVLLVTGEEWTARSLESVLSSRGMAVTKAYTFQQALQAWEDGPGGAVIVDRHLPDGRGVDLLSDLRESPAGGPGLVLLLLSVGPLARSERLEALEAGAWDVLHAPLDSEELVLKLRTYLGARGEASGQREGEHVDPATGLYNERGMLRRGEEVAAAAARHQRALAWIVLGRARGSGANGNGELPSEEDRRVADTLRDRLRRSDIVGRLDAENFVVLAPDTGPDGARVLARRLVALLGEQPASHASAAGFKAGYYAERTAGADPGGSGEMLARARLALKRSQRSRGRDVEAWAPD